MSGSSSSQSAGVKNVETFRELRQCLRDARNSLVVLEFMAPWSEPCRAMDRPYREVASDNEFSNVRFLALNFDKFQNLARRLGVEAMPVFLMVKNYRVESSIVALNKQELSNKIKQFK